MLPHPPGVTRHSRWDRPFPSLLPFFPHASSEASRAPHSAVSSADTTLPVVCTEPWVPGHKLAEKLPVYGWPSLDVWFPVL